MTVEQALLWKKIQSFELDDPSAALTFTARLARENGWTIEYAVRTVEEYKKFIFLICMTADSLTPSDQVDQVWHLHLLYTQSYWIDFCQNTIGKQIHHGPTKGGAQENNKYKDWYEKTKQLYVSVFEYQPPADIWQSSEIRFSKTNFRRVNLHQNWIIKKPFIFIK